MTERHCRLPHEQFLVEAAELAIAALERVVRAVLLDHVAACASCTSELEQMKAAAESLFLLTAEVDVPPGFESSVLDRFELYGHSEAGFDRSRHPLHHFCRAHGR
jgi:hypothetical protein